MHVHAQVPWTMTGECVIAPVGRPDIAGPLPAGLAALPGPALLVAERHAESPAGPFVTFVLGRPARLGVRAGICFVTAAVSSTDSRMAGRHHWGFPGEVASLHWDAGVDEHVIRWVERDVTVRATFGRRAVLLAIPFRAVQRREDGPVIVPGRLRGRTRTGRIHVEAPRLTGLGGGHRAIHVAGLRLVLHPARAPRGRLGTLLAPAPGVEPGYGFRPFSRTASPRSRVPAG